MSQTPTTRRELLAAISSLPLASLLPAAAFAQTAIPQRTIPATGEMLPIIGLGSSKVVQEIATEGEDPLRQVLRMLLSHGGRFVDTWPRSAENDAAFGRVISEPEFGDRLFVTTKIDQVGKDAGIAQFRQAQQLYQRETLDLVQIFRLTDLDTHWPSLIEWKESGAARYIGVTVDNERSYEPLEAFLHREKPDFVQVNYSVTERSSEERMIPLAAERGVAVVVNRPFMNGSYFDRLQGTPLPEWAREFDCESWAQFSLKYILANPDVTCILTETTNPRHMEENLLTTLGPVPDENARARMRTFIDSV
jgi:diketogulonate reductase-like aldo/keto reductase